MKIDFETIVIFVSFITSFFAVFLSNGINAKLSKPVVISSLAAARAVSAESCDTESAEAGSDLGLWA